MKTFLGLTAHHWWMLDTVLLLVLCALQWLYDPRRWCPRGGFEPTSQFDFDDWCAPALEDDPWNAVLYEKENTRGVQKR